MLSSTCTSRTDHRSPRLTSERRRPPALLFYRLAWASAVITTTYGYDALDRLTNAATPSTGYGYSYDSVGNRLSRAAGAGTDSYAYSSTSNRIASITPASGPVRSFSFDANGSTTADGTSTYGYD